ncbi:MAG: hypothetical protein EA411_12215 [Saprospirales bacterium]|nr:MAG: hypothetical protein EA411_12215 [Saprospirales bacterium]
MGGSECRILVSREAAMPKRKTQRDDLRPMSPEGKHPQKPTHPANRYTTGYIEVTPEKAIRHQLSGQSKIPQGN